MLKVLEILQQPAEEIAPQLLGACLTVEIAEAGEKTLPAGVYRLLLSEVEAYTEDEPSCHCFGGRRTLRNAPMFDPAGVLYVYFTYGMYHCMNIVTGPEGRGEAILVRSAILVNEAFEPIPSPLRLDGPGRLCRSLGIQRQAHNGLNLLDAASPIQLSQGVNISDSDIISTPRIGIRKATALPWRYVWKASNSE